MKKLIGSNKFKTAVFISGNGSNLKSLIRFSYLKKSPINIKIVISSNIKAKGLKIAKRFKIKTKIFSFDKNIKNENDVIHFLIRNKITFICLAGFMKILSKNFLNKFKGKILNIHPSLLPKYKGLNTHQRAINNNEKYSGCTVHLVNSKLDSGKIILQKKIRISNNETAKSLTEKILKQEHTLYPKAIKKLFSNR
tara:strand:- start:815 stop:1399 length:585 start_codon:yes stop_codon:yes gene_type:complete